MNAALQGLGLARPWPAPESPLLEAIGVRKRFGQQTVLDQVNLRLAPGSFHALLGENGAGKSTLVKCIMGYYRADAGAILVDDREQAIASPRDAHALGLGMVYQHFTLVPNMTVLENLVLARDDLPFVIRWPIERARAAKLMDGMPFRVDLEAPISALAAGEKQKVEILKQLFLQRRILILDEPTSVLTPDEADEMLSVLRALTAAGRLTVLMITHKFREVTAYADDYTVLRHGRCAGSGKVAETSVAELARCMVGAASLPAAAARTAVAAGETRLRIQGVSARNERGALAVSRLSLRVEAGGILGIAGVSGNGQRELVEVLGGQRDAIEGAIEVNGRSYRPRRSAMRRERIHCLPEEPLRSACVPTMTVAENLAMREFDTPRYKRLGAFIDRKAIIEAARALIEHFGVRPTSPSLAIGTLSGGNVQRAVLARELSGDIAVLIAADPCFGLDFAAIAEVRGRIMEARNRGAAVLLLSTDLDEIFAIADRIAVMFDGRIVHEARIAEADRGLVGRRMAGQ